MSPPQEVPKSGAIARYERDVHERIENFNDPRQEWRRLFSEMLGTFFLVLVAAGAGMMNTAFPGSISRGGRRTGAHGHGDHLVHGQGERCAPEPGRQYRFRPSRGLPVTSCAGLHRRPTRRRDPRRTLLARRLKGHVPLRVELPGARPFRRRGPVDGNHLDHGPRERNSRHCLGRAERRHPGRLRRRELHRPGRTVGQPAVGRLDEPGANLRTRSRGHQLHRFLGLRGRSHRGRRPRRRHRLRAAL